MSVAILFGACTGGDGTDDLPIAGARSSTAIRAASTVFEFCDSAGTADAPSDAWGSEEIPDEVADAARAHYGAELTAQNSVVWRCLSGDVYYCLSWGTNWCGPGATDEVPSTPAIAYCTDHPEADRIGRSIAGLATVWTWGCRDGLPYVVQRFARADSRGFHCDLWIRLEDGTVANDADVTSCGY